MRIRAYKCNNSIIYLYPLPRLQNMFRVYISSLSKNHSILLSEITSHYTLYRCTSEHDRSDTKLDFLGIQNAKNSGFQSYKIMRPVNVGHVFILLQNCS